MKRIALSVCVLTLAAAGSAYAAEWGNRPNPDGNGDGVVTRAESQSHAGQMFQLLDANKDGKLDQTDREARRVERRTKMFAALDADKNGQISQAEFMAFKPEGGRGKRGADHRMGHGGGMRGMADTNNDGAVSQAEFTASAQQRFDRIDANKDGQITKEERQAAHELMRGKWRERMHDKAET